MGFFSDIIRTVGGVIGGIIGGPAPAPAPVAVAPPRQFFPLPALQPMVQTVAQAVPIPPGAQPFASSFMSTAALGGLTAAQALVAPGIQASGQPGTQGVPGGGGNGRSFRVTTVSTFDLATGALLRFEKFPGAPFLMNNDVRKLRATARKLTKAHGRIPRRSVKESLTKQLTDAALQGALRRQLPCPPEKC